MLSLLIFLPIAVALVLGLVPKIDDQTAKVVGLISALATAAVSIAALLAFKLDTFHFQLEQRNAWIPSLGISFHVGVDGISIWLLVLTTLLSVVAAVVGVISMNDRCRLFMVSLLALEGAMLGAFVSLDLVLFFTFFEITLLPMWVMITTWGGEGRTKAAIKFVAFTFAGSIFMLIGIFALAYLYFANTKTWSFDVVDIQAQVANGQLWTQFALAQPYLFWFFAIGFLVKAPAFPFHAWIPDTYAESPIVGPILSCAMVKLGSYGLLRFCLPLFPDAVRAQSNVLMGLAAAGIVYGAVIAAVQTDMRRMLAYSTLSHMGFVLLGIFSLSQIGMIGGSLQQISHGVSAGLLFVLVGYLIQRRQTADFKAYGGLKASMPLFATLFMIAMLSSVGLPGLNGFVGEFLALLGAFESGFVHQSGLDVSFAIFAGVGVILAAVYLLYMFQQVFYGKLDRDENRSLVDVKPVEFALGAALVAITIIGGVQPNIFIKPMEASIQATRMMALNAVDKRPVWSDSGVEVDFSGKQPDRGALITIADNTVISGSDLHPGAVPFALPAGKKAQ